MPGSTKRDILLASGLLVGWIVCAGLIWRLAFRATVMSVSDPSLRSGLGMLGWLTSIWLSVVPVNLLHRRLGRPGNFYAWSIDVLNQAIKRKT